MFIKKIQIKNYRSCHLTEFNLNAQLSALIGPNGSGKTNILTAITLLKSLLHARGIRFRAERKILSSCTLKVWFNWKGKQIIFTAKLNINTDERNVDDIISTSESWYMY